jgi:hypothetical protein
MYEAVLRRLREYDQIMWDRTGIVAASVPAPAGGEHTGRNPTDRGKHVCKHDFLVDELRLFLMAQISGVQAHDARFLIPVVESTRAVKVPAAILQQDAMAGPVLAKATQLLQKATALAVK